MSNSSLNTDSSQLSFDFISLSMEVSRLARKAGSNLIPFHNIYLPHFSPLPTDKKQAIINHLKGQLSWLTTIEASLGTLDSNKHVLWHFIKSQDLVLRSDLMDKIKDDDVIEVHSLDGLYQIFNSFSFYDKSSYTLEELYSHPWHELYETDPQVQKNIFNLVQDVKEGRITETYNPNFPKYTVKELKSVFKFEVEIKYHWASPLLDRMGRPVAGVSVESMTVLNKTVSPAEKQKLIDLHFGVNAGLHLVD